MFKIGTFAKISHVATSQLRYYDEIDLFKPAHVDQFTDHRFYRIEQLPQLNRILVLKDLGLTLDQIRLLLGGEISSDGLRGMLMMKKAQVEQALHDELIRLHRIEARLQQIEQAEAGFANDVVIKSVQQQPILSIRDTFPSFAASQQLLAHLYPTARQNAALSAYVVILHSEAKKNDAIDVEMGFFLEDDGVNSLAIPNTSHILQPNLLVSVESMATILHQGDIHGILAEYGALGEWIANNHYQIVGAPREVYWDFEQVEDGGVNVIAEIQFPVVPITPNLT